jgi:large subunit ribosomal protein L17
MRHLNSINKLRRTATHRKAMLKNLAMSILDKEHVVTTLAKAKVVRGVVERLITHAKKGGVHSVRVAGKTVTDKDILKKLVTDIGPFYKTREGGYTRILKVQERPGDNALKCIIELTGRNAQEIALQRKKKKKSQGDAGIGSLPSVPAVEKKVSASLNVDESVKKETAKPVAKRKKKAESSEKTDDETKKK